MAKKKSLATTLESDMVHVRLPDGMRSRLRDLAASRGRTMNAEIVAALQEWIDNPEGHDEFAAQVDRIEKMIFQNNQLVAEQVRLLQAQNRLPIPKVSKAAEAKAFADFQEAVDATAKALQKRKAKTPQT